MVGSTVPNEVANKKVLAGVETIPGTAVTPTTYWLGELAITKSADLADRMDATGGYDRRVTPRMSPATFSGTYAEDLAFENLPRTVRYWLVGDTVGVSDAETTPGYVYTQSPAFATDNIDTATLQYGVDGLTFRSTGVSHNEGTITIDVDDTDGIWKFSSNLFVRSKEILPTVVEGVATGGTSTTVVDSGAAWVVNAYAGRYVNVGFDSGAGGVRQIVSNTATALTVSPAFDVTPVASDTYRIEAAFTSGLSRPDYEYIPTYGTQVFVDALDGTLGDTEILDRIISANITVGNQRTPKRFLDNAKNEVSAKTGRGARTISGQLRVEFDRFDEYNRWETLDGFQLRIYQEGSVIDATATPNPTVKYAQIDLPVCYFSTPTEDARENNMTMTLPFWAFLPDSDPILTVETKNALAAMGA
jgi:hypothetical protein